MILYCHRDCQQVLCILDDFSETKIYPYMDEISTKTDLYHKVCVFSGCWVDKFHLQSFLLGKRTKKPRSVLMTNMEEYHCEIMLL